MDDFIAWFDTGARLNINCENTMGTGWAWIKHMTSNWTIEVTFKQAVKRILFRVTDVLLQTFYKHSSTGILWNLKVLFGFGIK